MFCFIAYWEIIYKEIIGPLPTHLNALHEGFWPILDWKTDHTCNFSIDGVPDNVLSLIFKNDLKPYF